MPGKQATTDQLKQALALRAAGLSRTVISDQTGLSESTISRICRRHKAKKGSIIDKIAEETQRQLVDYLSNDQNLKVEAAKLVFEDLALSRLLRDKLATTILNLDTTDPKSAAVTARALNSAASALVSTQKASRIAINADHEAMTEADLPILKIEELTAEEIEQIRATQIESRDL